MHITPAFMSELEQQARQLRADRALGRSNALSRLFEYLLQRSLAGHAAPKEIEIALHVFHKPADFDGSSDALVRVYVHKLRRRLEEYYLRAPGLGRIVIPRGEYRLVLERTEEAPFMPAPVTKPEPQRPTTTPIPPPWKHRVLSAVAIFAAAVLGAAIGMTLTANAASDSYSCGSR